MRGSSTGPRDDPAALAPIKADPGNVSMDSMLTEISKLRVVRGWR